MDALSSFLVTRASTPNEDCTEDTCPIEQSYYGYAPNLGANAFFAVVFAISMTAHLVQGIKGRCWSFLIAMVVGTFGEVAGYIGRIMLSNDPFSETGFQVQIISLTVAPAFLAAGIYLTLKHMVIIFGASFSRIAPRWYTWIFISCDILSILVQAMGAVTAAVGNNADLGNNLMIFGLAFQVFTLGIFGIMAAEYVYRVRKFGHNLNASTRQLRHSRRFKGLLATIVTSFTGILIRCIYRLIEMAGGWGNEIMKNETLFIVLDSVPCLIAAVVFNGYHPAFLFRESTLAGKQDAYNTEATDRADGTAADLPLHSVEQRERRMP